MRRFSSAAVLVEKSVTDGVALIKLNNPPANALSLPVVQQLNAAFSEIKAAKEVKGVILTGSPAPSIFSAGLDIREMHQPDKARFEQFWGGLQDLFVSLYGSQQPTVAAISGAAPAGGCWLSLQCDYRVMCEGPKSVIGLNETQLGIVAPQWFYQPMVDAVGTRQADRLLQLGLLVPATEALSLGLIDELVPAAALMEKAQGALGQYMRIPSAARVKTKLALRGDLLATLASPQQRAADTEATWQFMTQPRIQAAMGAYLQALQSKGKK